MNNDSHTFFTTFIFKFFLTLFYLIVKIDFFFFQFSISNYCIRCNTLSSSLDLDKLGSMVVFFFFWSKR